MAKYEICFTLTKDDSGDFDRELVSKLLEMVPSYSEAPRISKGVLRCDDLAEATETMRGSTIFPSKTDMHNFLLHAYWQIIISPIDFQSFEEALLSLKERLDGKVQILVNLCDELNLFVDVDLNVYTEYNNLPDMFLSSETIAFLSSINASFSINLHCDEDFTC